MIRRFLVYFSIPFYNHLELRRPYQCHSVHAGALVA